MSAGAVVRSTRQTRAYQCWVFAMCNTAVSVDEWEWKAQSIHCNRWWSEGLMLMTTTESRQPESSRVMKTLSARPSWRVWSESCSVIPKQSISWCSLQLSTVSSCFHFWLVSFIHICMICLVYMQNSLTKSCPLDHEKQVVCSHPGPRVLTSYNRHFVIKSIQSEQVAEMHRILSAYHQVCLSYIAQLTFIFSDLCILFQHSLVRSLLTVLECVNSMLRHQNSTDGGIAEL